MTSQPLLIFAVRLTSLFLLLRLGHLCLLCQPQPAITSPGTNVLSLVQGTVEVRKRDTTSFIPGRLNDVLARGDRVQTGERSRAEVALVSGTIIKLASLGDLEIPPTDDVTLRRGIFQIFNRDRFSGGTFRLPGATAAIRGTDFLVRVSDAEITLGVLDGEVTLSNDFGKVDLGLGEQGIIKPGQPPVRARLDLDDPTLMQWSFYYPAVLNPNDLSFPATDMAALAASISVYAQGHLPDAFQSYPWNRVPASDAERSYRAELLLSVGEVDQALGLLATLPDQSHDKNALLALIAAVRRDVLPQTNSPATSSEWLARSYYLQARAQLEYARDAAREATKKDPEFGFAWARLAELEFGFADRKSVRAALDRALDRSPRNTHAVALHGFSLAAEGQIEAARDEFERAIELDSSYANAWLGRGLTLIRGGLEQRGQRDLFVAASLEPQRALYRSYLGKSFQEIEDDRHARRELEIAKRLDPKDPTAWLYSAILNQLENRINDAVRDLEHSQAAVENRRLFRSRLLLDEDLAVRGANLAAIYREAGLEDVSVREAAEAVRQDYANFSAHLFLANSYNSLRDASLANLRYESATFSEYLIANLLSPIGGTPLSQQVSQQEYSRLFERNRLGLASETSYLSSGAWQQSAAQYGIYNDFAYALEGTYRVLPGDGPNSDLEQTALSLQLKEQLSPDDSVYFQTVYNHVNFGDVLQRFDPATASPTLRNREVQDPNFFLGAHHQWSPGSHTLLLLSNLRDNIQSAEPHGRVSGLLASDTGAITNTMGALFGPGGEAFGVDYTSEFDLLGAELQQILRLPGHTFIAGLRAQTGTVDTRSLLNFRGDFIPGLYYETDLDPQQRITHSLLQTARSDFNRLSGYAYWQWQIVDPFSLFGGLTFDQVTFPENIVSSPITTAEREERQLSPKAGFTWTLDRSSTIRGAYSRSLGGLFYDSSVRLEPVELAGFNQTFRSLAPESIAGIVPGTEFETFDLGSEHQVFSNTYFGWQAELLQSHAERSVGVFAGNPTDFFTLLASQERQQIEYRERSLLFYFNQLIAAGWSLGARYRVTDSEFNLQTSGVSPSTWPEGHSDRAALLHQLSLYTIYNHSSGWFAGTQALWTMQNNRGDDASLGTEEFWQFNCYGGYRFPRRRAEITVGLLNLASQDYRLNPVSLYTALPRERTFFANLRFNF